MARVTDKRWYHYLMVSFLLQLTIAGSSVVILMIQLMIYISIADKVTIYQGPCELAEAPEGDAQLIAQCGDRTVNLTDKQEALVYHTRLTTSRNPAIICEITETEYFKDVNATCHIEP